jgi:chromosome partitioning protein
MMKVAILSQKGGAGKTTLGLNIAIAAEMDGKQTAIIDLDPQSSMAQWGDSRESQTPTVVTTQAQRLLNVLETCADNDGEFIVIDTAPHAEQTALAAARAADVVLIPCRPSIVDLRAIGMTIEICQLAQTPCFVVLNQTPCRGTLTKEAEAAIKGLGVALSPIQIGQRVSYIHAVTQGQGVLEYEPRSKAADEIRALYKFIIKEIGIHTNGKKERLSSCVA